MNNICYIIQEYIGYILFALAYSKIKDVNRKVGKFGQFQNMSKPLGQPYYNSIWICSSYIILCTFLIKISNIFFSSLSTAGPSAETSQPEQKETSSPVSILDFTKLELSFSGADAPPHSSFDIGWVAPFFVSNFCAVASSGRTLRLCRSKIWFCS